MHSQVEIMSGWKWDNIENNILELNKQFRGVITTKATKAAALVDFWDYIYNKL